MKHRLNRRPQATKGAGTRAKFDTIKKMEIGRKSFEKAQKELMNDPSLVNSGNGEINSLSIPSALEGTPVLPIPTVSQELIDATMNVAQKARDDKMLAFCVSSSELLGSMAQLTARLLEESHQELGKITADPAHWAELSFKDRLKHLEMITRSLQNVGSTLRHFHPPPNTKKGDASGGGIHINKGVVLYNPPEGRVELDRQLDEFERILGRKSGPVIAIPAVAGESNNT